MGVSRRSYAAQRGVSEEAVRKVISTGQSATLMEASICLTHDVMEKGEKRSYQRGSNACLTDHPLWAPGS